MYVGKKKTSNRLSQPLVGHSPFSHASLTLLHLMPIFDNP